MNKSKSLFMGTMIMGTMITVSSNNWISMWMGLEMNMMSFIPLIIKQNNKLSSEAALIYFLTQSVSSMLLLFSILAVGGGMEMQLFINLGVISVLVKLGAAPFHMWFPEVMSKMSWENCTLLMTWQKIAPMMVINNMQYSNNIMYITVMLSTMVGAIGGLNQTSLRKLMGYSSINHLGWMLILNKTQNNWCNYLLIYSMMITTMCYMFNYYKMFFINQINSCNFSMSEKITYVIALMSLGGLPPFLGFILKWMVIQTMIQDKMITLMTIMIMFSLITLFYYLRMITSMLLTFSSANKWMTFKSNNNINIMITMLNMSLPLMTIINFN
uniref:NADH-ubiquinone oxidoreductase chain 2 n=1 Tax=Adrisa magna TaxID=1289575 RepID=A0A4Y1JNC9_9HEMI|nr:NADH dehydrogenase subunit 2 [Adrisa magna]AMR74994.1 NADH dehydrogenase subunit 2 [Adrisa magna]